MVATGLKAQGSIAAASKVGTERAPADSRVLATTGVVPQRINTVGRVVVASSARVSAASPVAVLLLPVVLD
jgi:hypothetical protein